jgi:hypothetical protein
LSNPTHFAFVTTVNFVKESPMPIRKGTIKNSVKASNVGRTKIGKYFESDFLIMFSS